jgi:hypothetical protein
VFYRLYTLGDSDRITRPAAFLEADTDEAAIEQAKQLLDGHDLELWQGKRLVVRLPHTK